MTKCPRKSHLERSQIKIKVCISRYKRLETYYGVSVYFQRLGISFIRHYLPCKLAETFGTVSVAILNWLLNSKEPHSHVGQERNPRYRVLKWDTVRKSKIEKNIKKPLMFHTNKINFLLVISIKMAYIFFKF